MQGFSVHWTLLIMGLTLLYTGVEMQQAGAPGEWTGWLMIFGGMGLTYIALAYWGDEKPLLTRYKDRPKRPTHIASIPEGEGYSAILSEAEEAKMRELIQAQRIMDAIRFYRESTGHGLVEAKSYIDKIIKDSRSTGRS